MAGAKTNVDTVNLTHQATADARNSRTRAPAARHLGCAVRLVFQTEQAEQERGAIGAGDEGSVVHRVPDGVAEAVGAIDGARRAGPAPFRAV